jgi:hypothetical protein
MDRNGRMVRLGYRSARSPRAIASVSGDGATPSSSASSFRHFT